MRYSMNKVGLGAGVGLLVALGVTHVACDEKGKDGSTPGASSASSLGAQTTPQSAPNAAGSVAASAAAPIASALTTALASATPSFAAAGSAVAAQASAAASAASAKTAASAGAKNDAKPVGLHVTGSNFAVDVSAPGNCVVNGACTMAIKLTALGKFHINDEYPYKWVGDPIDGIDYTGKKTGDFRKDSPTQGTMLVAFKSAGQNAKVSGVYKMSVCSEDKCQIETQRVELNVPMN